MRVEPHIVAWSLLAPFLLGVLALRALGIGWRSDRLAWPAWSWMAGAAGCAAGLLAAAAVGVPREWWWSSPIAVAAALAVAMKLGLRARPVAPDGARPSWAWSLPGGAGLLVVVAASGVHFLAKDADPVVISDEAFIWAAKAKVIWTAEGLGPEVESIYASTPVLTHPDYPLLNPLLQLWVYANAGRIVHFESRLPIQLFALALLFLLAAALRRIVCWPLALLLVLLYATTRNFRYHGGLVYADLIMTTGLLVALDGWLRWRRTGDRGWARLSALGLLVACWSKNEALMYLVAAAVGVGASWIVGRRPERSRAERAYAAAWLAALPGAAVAVTWIINRRFGFANDMVEGGGAGRPFWVLAFEQAAERIGPVLRYVWNDVFLKPYHNQGLYLIFLAGVVAVPRAAFAPRVRPLTIGLLATLAGYVAVYLGSHHDLEWHLKTSAWRVLFQSLPIFAVWIALVVSEAWPRLAVRG